MPAEKHPGHSEDQYCVSIENHERHICQLITRVTAGEIIDLVDLPGFICENCARAANSPEFLCRPLSLEERNEE